MKVFKFGGASVKDANGVKNVLQVLQVEGTGEKLVVISAMGKSTNALEVVVKDYLQKGDFNDALQPEKNFIGRSCSVSLKTKIIQLLRL